MTTTMSHHHSDDWASPADPQLLVIDKSDEDWKPLGSCRNSDPDAWFPAREDVVDIQRAIAICRNCPVQAQCLAYALARDEHFGVWGGVFLEDSIQRRRLRLSR